MIIVELATEEDRGEVDAVAAQQVLRLDSGQHGIGPTQLVLALVLYGRHGQQHLVGVVVRILLRLGLAGRHQACPDEDKRQEPMCSSFVLHGCKVTNKWLNGQKNSGTFAFATADDKQARFASYYK